MNTERRYLVRLYDGPRPVGVAYSPVPIQGGDVLRLGGRWFIAAGTGAADLAEPMLGPVVDLIAEDDE